MNTIKRGLSERGGIVSEVIGYYSDYSLECVACLSQGEPATAEALPDGFTCDSCGVVVNA